MPATDRSSADGPARDLRIIPETLSAAEQRDLVALISEAAGEAPFYRPVMPTSGKPFSVLETNLGPLGWVSDREGYRYQPHHPETGHAWPAIPGMLLDLWDRLTGYVAPPECCLVNLYRDGAKMGLHQDRDEQAMDAPVLSLSLGDTALFRWGGKARRGPTRSVRLASGDAVVLEGDARLCFHGIDRVLPGTSTLIDGGGRLNLTLRRVKAP